MNKPASPLRQLKASAGSGKTYALTGDILALLRGAEDRGVSGCVRPSSGHMAWPEVLGVTFTNRAATEMKDRVLLSLKKMALEEEPPHAGWTAARAAQVLESLVRQAGALNIRTIDSLIHLIVRLSALDLDLPPDFESVFSDTELMAPLLDELAERAREGDDELRREYTLACSQILYGGRFRGFLAGDRIRSGIADIASLFLAGSGMEDLEFSGVEEVRAEMASLCRNFRTRAAELHEALQGYAVNTYLVRALEKSMDELCADTDLPSDSAMFAKDHVDLCLIKPRDKSQKGKGDADETLCVMYARVCDAARELETTGKILAGALGLMPYVDLAKKALQELARFQHGSRQVPASTIPGLADKVLGGRYGVSEAFCRMGNRLTHILVDEFQDTSRSQWEALKPLAVEALSRGGSLTVVGDIKQAIYGWRGGEAELFDEVPADPELTAMVPEPGLERLGANWRSRSEIIAWNNAVFSRLEEETCSRTIIRTLMREEGGPGLLEQAAGKLVRVFDGVSQQDARQKPGGMVRLSLLRPMGAPDMAAYIEHALPERILEIRARGRRWRDMCILTQTNRQTTDAARWLLDVGVPVVTEGSLLLAEQPLIVQTVALLEFLDSPDDDRAFWSVLLGRTLLPPVPELDDLTLHGWLAGRVAARQQGGKGGSLAALFRRDFPRIWEEVFAPLLDGAGLLTPYDTVHEVYQRWQVWKRHPESEGFLLRFLEVAHLAEQRGNLDLSAFLRHWRDRGGEEKAPLPENMDAIRIMTIHKAKGLEAEVVLVPWSDFSLRDRLENAVLRVGRLTVLAPVTKAVGELFYRQRADNAQEAMHLLYVAWTRAVSELHVFITDPESGPMAQAVHELIGPLLRAGEGMRQLGEGEWQWGGTEPAASSTVPSGPTLGGLAGTGLKEAGGSVDDWADIQDGEQSEDWRPMGWLPRLKIFRSPLENWTLSARRRGILLHRCLEFLRIGTDPKADAERAVRRGLMGLPLFERSELERDFTASLTWFAGLAEARVWMGQGSPEHALLDAQGGLRRVDLLVQGRKGHLAVEYKTGAGGDLPVQEHVDQLKNYLELLEKSVGEPVGGVLVYLDHQMLFRFGEEL